MGKVKPRHKNKNRDKSQPTGIQSVKNAELQESELSPSGNDLALQNVIEEIQSSRVEDKLCGLQSLINLTEKSTSVENIIKFNILKIVAPFLIDKNSEVRNLTAGVLRNLSAGGSIEICERLVKEDIMTPLLALLQQYNDWKPESSKSENTDTLIQVINTLWNLCEFDETALKHFNSAKVLDVLFRCLDYETVGVDLAITVCQCLNAVSENNEAVIVALLDHESKLLPLLSITVADHKLLLLRTLVASITLNIVKVLSDDKWLVGVLTTVSEALCRDLRGSAKQLSSQLTLDASVELPTDVEALCDQALALTDAQTLALETITNLIASQDDEMDLDMDHDSDEEINGWGETEESQPLALSTEILEGLTKYNLVPAVLSKTEPLPLNVMDILTTCPYSKILAKRLRRLQCRAFLCLNNLVSVVDMEELGGASQLYALVKQISTHSVNQQQEMEVVEAGTAAIRALLQRLASCNFTALGDLQPADLQVMINIGQSDELRIKANVFRIFGALGTLLVHSNKHPDLVRVTGDYLLGAAEQPLPLWLAAEALDALLDVFSEDGSDQVAADLGLVPRLQALAPRLKAKMRQEKNTLEEHYPLVSTVMTNLTPFIKYKGARVSALTNC